MQYTYCSLTSVIGNIIRNTGLQDAGVIPDIHEWAFEAMKLLETQFSLQGAWKDVNIVFHKGELPCTLEYITAVEYNGMRLKENRSGRTADRSSFMGSASQNVFQGIVEKIEPVPDHLLYTTRVEAVSKYPICPNAYYYTEMGKINTSFTEGTVTVFFMEIETDEAGMPKIPDNQNYKNAVYWYVRAMMIGSGWVDKQFNFQTAMQMYEMYAGRAMAEITYPSPEQMEHRVDTFTRLLPNAGFYDSYFMTDRNEGFYETSQWQ